MRSSQWFRAASARRCVPTGGGCSRRSCSLILSAFVIYATWAAFQGEHYTWGPYLSPFYSPELFGSSPHAWFGPQPAWWPAWLVFSPALLILPFPGSSGSRVTTTGAPTTRRSGPTRRRAPSVSRGRATGARPRSPDPSEHPSLLPVRGAGVHRPPRRPTCGRRCGSPTRVTGRTTFGIGVGTLVLALNVTLLAGYTLGCHSLRHVVGGYLDQLSRSPTRKRLYDCSSCLNRRHMRWAWMSLFSVAFADLYVRLCSMGIWTDWRIF